MHKIGLLLFLIYSLLDVDQINATILEAGSIPQKQIGDTFSADEFNQTIGIIRGITKDDNDTPNDFSDDRWGFGVPTPQTTIDFNGDITAAHFYGSGKFLTELPWTRNGNTIYASTNVGIGSSIANDFLHLTSDANFILPTALRIEANYPAIRLAEKDGIPNQNWEINLLNGSMHFASSNDSYSALTGHIVLTQDGNLGIGVGAPNQKLEVNGNILVGNSNDVCIAGGNCLSSLDDFAPELTSDESDNIYFGAMSGADDSGANKNTAVGAYSLQHNGSGSENVVIGYEAANGKDSGSVTIDKSVIIGAYAGKDLKSNEGNILIGHKAGESIHNGEKNIVIGFNQDIPHKNDNERLNIGGVIFGNLANERIGIANTNPSFTLDVNGTIRGSNVSPSDKRLKTNIHPLDSSEILEKVLKIEGQTFNWKTNPTTNPEFGFIAQDVELLFPELVLTDQEGLKSVNYEKMVPLLLEAIKAQQAQIEALKN